MIDIGTAVTNLATLPAILALVNLGKRFGLSGPWSALAAVILGVALSMAEQAWGASPVFAAARTGLILGLGAAGLYDLRQSVPLPEIQGEGYDPKYDIPPEPETQLTATIGPGDDKPVIAREALYRDDSGQ